MKLTVFVAGVHNVFLAACAAGCVIFLQGVSHQWLFECNVKIVAINYVCQQPLNNRCQYEYIGQGRNGAVGTVDFNYMAGRDQLAESDWVTKEKFGFDYRLNGQKMTWRSWSYYLRILFFGVISLFVWRYLTVRASRLNKEH